MGKQRSQYKDVINAIKNKGLSITTPVPGTTVDLDPAVKLEILAPNSSSYDNLNNYSIVFKLTYGSKSFLFTGDAENISEKEMLSKGYSLKADVLKVGHHGSTSSTTSEFLSAVAPQYAVISVGKGNDYGHPAQTTLDKLKNAGVTVYRTDECGVIIATTDGNTVTFNTNPGSFNGAGSSNSSKTDTTPTQTTPNTSIQHGLIKGNINSKGEKIYHVPGGGVYYDKTDAEEWFYTEAEAQAVWITSYLKRYVNVECSRVK
ncbi:MBL fold metallo-hydrolase [Clostridium sp. DJ247]|uniref:ComEC/Rec2 family competence protein n=1 Tax=Clostridium sp. DJ247 TaxID=2726188 RepID=UPI0016240B7B|nr:MBL fold metallo-hydrolase [Clostridium sp. DJ247]MBC2579110.1 MBL fold metallo-hydrolase [Clostridium sp. DJ247]